MSICTPISTTFDTECLLRETDPKKQKLQGKPKMTVYNRIIGPQCVGNMFELQIK